MSKRVAFYGNPSIADFHYKKIGSTSQTLGFFAMYYKKWFFRIFLLPDFQYSA
jgi:hypothetical protein